MAGRERKPQEPARLVLGAMSRRFARLRPGAPPFAPGDYGVPSDGMCLSAFLVVTAPTDPSRVLLGRMAPNPRWEEVGGLDPARTRRIADRWMLPSRQLQFFESPEEAARGIGEEQLGIQVDPVPTPRIFSETYPRPASAESDPHWDLHFIFVLTGPASPPRSPLWRELTYVSVGTLSRGTFARGHGDILELVGLSPAA
ncbi:MAG: hypothetical protein L3K10_07580 [Thermoplasmata archaeon]|nr:hypothetical protein [Thermoplasmata archaeon]